MNDRVEGGLTIATALLCLFTTLIDPRLAVALTAALLGGVVTRRALEADAASRSTSR